MVINVRCELKNRLRSCKGLRLPVPTSGPGESELDRIFNAHGLSFAAQTNEADAVVDALGAVPVANVQRHSFPFRLKEQPIQQLRSAT